MTQQTLSAGQISTQPQTSAIVSRDLTVCQAWNASLLLQISGSGNDKQDGGSEAGLQGQSTSS